MIILFNGMDLITPALGFVFWTTLAFIIFWFVLGKFAFKPIVNSIEARNAKIESELLSAQKARLEFENIVAEKNNMEKLAYQQRAELLLEAKNEVEAFRNAEMLKAKEEASKALESAKIEINNQKNAAILEVKNEVANLSLTIAEKLLRENLSSDINHKNLVNKLVAES